MKTIQLILVPFLLGLTLAGCGGNAGTNPEPDPDPAPSQITHDDFTPEGNVTETANGYTVDGKLSLKTETDETMVFLNAKLTLEFNPDGTLKNITGAAEIPSPTNFIEFANPVQADLGYFSGKFLNESREFDILLKEEISYFVFRIAVALEMKVGGNDDPNATKPLTIKPPVGGHILYVADYNDPLFYFSAAQDALGSLCFGASLEGKIPYVPLQPVPQVDTFDGRSIRSGSFSFFKVIEASGVLIRNEEFKAQLVESDPLGASFSAGFQAGINGSFDLSVPIVKFVSFGIPLAEASAAVVAEASTQNGFVGKAFINGLAAPDNSWWPDFVPVKPGGQLRTTGFVQQDGTFNLALQGQFNLQLPSTTEKYSGSVSATNEDFTMTGSVTHDDLTWSARATFLKDQTEYTATPPEALLNDIGTLVNVEIDSTFDEIERARQALEDATADYEFELSLRGLRESLPTIVSDAKSRLSSGLSSGETKARNKVKSELDKNGLKLCSDNLHSIITSAAAPFFSALNRLKAAAEETQDNDRTRSEIEAVLRDIASRKRLKKTVTATLKVASKIVGCGITSTQTRSVSIDVQLIPDAQVNQLLAAADNVKFIAETSDLKIKAQQIFDRIPSTKQLEQLRADLQSGVTQIPEVGKVGFIYTHQDKTYAFFIVLNGKRHDVSEFDMFSGGGVGGVIASILAQGN